MSPLYASREKAEAAAEKLRIFAQPQRLMILSLLQAKGEQNVSGIDEATGIGQPALSQQLAELRKAGLVEVRRQARQVYYSLADEGTRLCTRTLEAVFGAGEGASLEAVAAAMMEAQPTPSAVGKPVSGAAHFARIIPR